MPRLQGCRTAGGHSASQLGLGSGRQAAWGGGDRHAHGVFRIPTAMLSGRMLSRTKPEGTTLAEQEWLSWGLRTPQGRLFSGNSKQQCLLQCTGVGRRRREAWFSHNAITALPPDGDLFCAVQSEFFLGKHARGEGVFLFPLRKDVASRLKCFAEQFKSDYHPEDKEARPADSAAFPALQAPYQKKMMNQTSLTSALDRLRGLVLSAAGVGAGALGVPEAIQWWAQPRQLKLGTLDKYILRQLAGPFALATLAITFLGLSLATSHELAAITRTSWPQVSQFAAASALWIHRTPFYAGLAVPMAALVAALLAFGQLAGNSETVALHACGVGPRRVAALVSLTFLVIAGLHLAFADVITPAANKQAAALMRVVQQRGGAKPDKSILALASEASKTDSSTVRQAIITPEFRNNKLERLFYARRCHDGTMDKVTVVEMDNTEATVSNPFEGFPDLLSLKGHKGRGEVSSLRRIITAESATWDPTARSWKFHEGSLYRFGPVTSTGATPPSLAEGFEATPATEIGNGRFQESAAAETSRSGEGLARAVVGTDSGKEEHAQRASIHRESDTGREELERPGDEASTRQGEHATMSSASELDTEASGKKPGSAWGLTSWSHFHTKRLGARAKRTSGGIAEHVGARRDRVGGAQTEGGIGRVPLDLALLGMGRSLDDMSVGEMRQLEALLSLSRNRKDATNVCVKLHQRLALPFASPVFATLGTVTSLRLPPSRSSLGFAMALAIIFLYYSASVTGVLLAQVGVRSNEPFLFLCPWGSFLGQPKPSVTGVLLAKLQVMHPVLAAWLPNLAGLIATIVLLSDFSGERFHQFLLDQAKVKQPADPPASDDDFYA